MRILQFTYDLRPSGAVSRICLLAEHASRVETCIYIWSDQTDFASALKKRLHYLHLGRCERPAKLNIVLILKFYLSLFFELKKICRSARYDYLYINGSMLLPLLIFIPLLGRRQKFVFHLNDTFVSGSLSRWVGAAVSLSGQKIKLVASSEELAKYYGLSDALILLPPIAPNFIRKSSFTKTVNKNLVFGFMANFTRNKGQLALLNALREIDLNLLKVPLEIEFAGSVLQNDQHYFPEVNRCLDELNGSHDLVTLKVSPIRADPLKFFRRIDCLVCCSEREGMPTVFLEALMCGVPILTTRVSGVEQIMSLLNEYECGDFITIYETVNDLASSLISYEFPKQSNEQLSLLRSELIERCSAKNSSNNLEAFLNG